ncbi:P-loop containing nucleoside triphosphate hydrolase protein [Daldinia decipiens]|uniref:P-loop containing nucleoside triphosphate hydrolase protein n=1 Tax=Daldinia decipiens TaxID=326647 RepID=UPI0020C3F79B|nr:P-loop containing nucleoside triphosphate hydrolase protein [Daldinia decipiens]KAI1659826.1 P-loop containing nucleoside triphosphate hydrolase protein [Daldinia decipiens]
MDNFQPSQATEQDPPPSLVSWWYGQPDNQGQLQWSTSTNDKEEFSDLLARTSSIPIIHRSVLKQGTWETYSITIQDPVMRKILGDVLRKYQDLDLKKEKWTFRPPFQPLLDRWRKIERYATKAKADLEVANALERLVFVLSPIIKPLLPSSKNIDFANIQHIFTPGTLVFSKKHHAETVSRVLKCQQAKPRRWEIGVEHVDWNGKECGYREYSFTIKQFDGYCGVTELDVFPISYLADETKFRAACIERGRKFEQLGGYKLMICCKKTKIWDSRDRRWQIKLAGSKFCVDAFAYYDNRNSGKPKLRPLDGNGKHPVKDGIEGSKTASESLPAPSVRRKEHLQPLTDEQRLMIHPWLRCFDLQTKRWCKVLIDDLEEATSNDLAFEKLLLPDNEKEALLNLVKGKLLAGDLGNNDSIQNQGRGLTCLMFGPSGVGKTFTAEAIADKLSLPLYSMVGKNPGEACEDLQTYLQQGPKLCRLWDGILLIEEADSLIAAQDGEPVIDDGYEEFEIYGEYDFVPVFLWTLKNYTGILFLTVNEVGDIGSALRPHINHFMPYSSLGIQTRRQIWRNLIEDSGKDNFIRSSEDMDDVLSELSKFDLNGHEINNLVKSVRMIALGSEDSDNKVSLDTLCLLAHNWVQSLRP